MEAGGTLIAFGNTAAFLADAERGLSSVRLRSHVLGELAVYVEAVQRERAARRVEIDPSEVWHRVAPPRLEREDDLSSTDSKADEASSSGKELAGKGSSGDVDALKRRDQWLELFRPNGAIAAGDINTEHWLCFGLSDANGSDPVLPVLLTGRHVLMSKHPVETPVRLRGKDALRLSGLIWPEARERWADSAYATVERVGKGQIILFASDPFFRAYFEGSGRLLLNALLLGPGLGASPPLPW